MSELNPIKTKTEIVILQHPQEPGVEIGTVQIISQLFPHAMVKTGLSWPNLKKILSKEVDNKRWGVLYLGSVRVETLPKEMPLIAVNKKGALMEDQAQILAKLQGVVLLDGTWSQAKTLWWRNAWLLKLQRLVLNPGYRSRYDQIRKEPRKGCLSTLESLAEALSALEKRNDIKEVIEVPLGELIKRAS